MTRLRDAAGLLVLAAALAAAVGAPRRAADRAVLAAVDAPSFAGLIGRRPAAAGELWERLHAMGVSAAVLREETVADLAARGEVLSFSPAEVEKWRAAGLNSPAAMRGGTLWSKDSKALARAAAALSSRGVEVSTTVVAGTKALEIPAGTDLSLVPAGFDPGEVSAVAASGLLPVAASTAPALEVAGRLLWTRTLPPGAARGELLRAALGRPMRLIVFRARADLALGPNLELLRSSLRTLRDAGQPSVPAAPRGSPGDGESSRPWREAAAWLIGGLAPLLAVRAALRAARLARAPVLAAVPVASPVPQILAGLAAAWAAAAFAGLAAAGAAPEGWRDGSHRSWTLWTWFAPACVACAAFFLSSGGSRRGWSAPVRRRDLAALAAAAGIAVLLVAPRGAVRVSAFWESFDRISAAGALWWWPWRWREALVGVPCLSVALSLVERFEGGDVQAPDPRVWLALGLLAPSGLTAAVGGGGAPLPDALVQGGIAWTIGFAVSGAFVALLSFPLKSQRR